MRYREIIQSDEKSSETSALPKTATAPSPAKSSQPSQPAQQVKRQPDQSVEKPKFNPTIEMFINDCIPSEVSESDEAEARAWLRTQLTDVSQLGKYNANQIRLSLRSIGNTDRSENLTLADYTIDQILRMKPAMKSNMDDHAAIAKLKSVSMRLSQDVILTVMSGLSDDNITMDQNLYDTLSYYIGTRYNAGRLQRSIASKFGTVHGVFCIIRNLKDSNVYVNVLIDTDARVIRAGSRIEGLKLLTSRSHKFSSERLSDIVFELNSPEERELYNVTDPLLERVQSMMNEDSITDVYDYFGVSYANDTIANLTKKDDDKIERAVK